MTSVTAALYPTCIEIRACVKCLLMNKFLTLAPSAADPGPAWGANREAKFVPLPFLIPHHPAHPLGFVAQVFLCPVGYFLRLAFIALYRPHPTHQIWSSLTTNTSLMCPMCHFHLLLRVKKGSKGIRESWKPLSSNPYDLQQHLLNLHTSWREIQTTYISLIPRGYVHVEQAW